MNKEAEFTLWNLFFRPLILMPFRGSDLEIIGWSVCIRSSLEL